MISTPMRRTHTACQRPPPRSSGVERFGFIQSAATVPASLCPVGAGSPAHFRGLDIPKSSAESPAVVGAGEPRENGISLRCQNPWLKLEKRPCLHRDCKRLDIHVTGRKLVAPVGPPAEGRPFCLAVGESSS